MASKLPIDSDNANEDSVTCPNCKTFTKRDQLIRPPLSIRSFGLCCPICYTFIEEYK
jgi:hypothetical protein